MISSSLVLDVILLCALLGAVVSGLGVGLVRSLSGMAGFLLGAVAAYFAVPYVGSWIPAPEWRASATLVVVAALLLFGLSVGATIGRALRRQADRSRLRIVDRLLGAVLTGAMTALVISLLASGVAALGAPALSPAIASSAVIRTIDALTPAPLSTFLAQLRSAAVRDGLPRIVEAFSGPIPAIPDLDTGSTALSRSAQSVVRITGTAYSCGQSQSGSGFVIAPDRILTNAHVVAGVDEPIVQVPAGGAYLGEVVYFDPDNDLAVIAVQGLSAPALERSGNLAPGDSAVADGYPFGGPFVSDPAAVISIGSQLVQNIYGGPPAPRQIYELASDVQSGESGGPLLDQNGRVVGVVFAKATTTPNIGFAIGMDVLEPVAGQAASLDSPVPTGACVRL